MKDLDEKVNDIICECCGDDFEHPGSCEECMDDDEINNLRKYNLKVAKGEIKDSLSLYSLYK